MIQTTPRRLVKFKNTRKTPTSITPSKATLITVTASHNKNKQTTQSHKNIKFFPPEHNRPCLLFVPKLQKPQDNRNRRVSSLSIFNKGCENLSMIDISKIIRDTEPHQQSINSPTRNKTILGHMQDYELTESDVVTNQEDAKDTIKEFRSTFFTSEPRSLGTMLPNVYDLEYRNNHKSSLYNSILQEQILKKDPRKPRRQISLFDKVHLANNKNISTNYSTISQGLLFSPRRCNSILKTSSSRKIHGYKSRRGKPGFKKEDGCKTIDVEVLLRMQKPSII